MAKKYIITADDVIDNLTSDLEDVPLSANQGRVLKGLISGITPSSIGAEPEFTKNGAFNKNFGNASGTVCEGNDARLSDARTPTSHASTATTYGVSSATNYGHAKASSATPADLGTASVGTDNGLYARGDHVHRDWKHISTADPTASDGVNGDVWFKYEE